MKLTGFAILLFLLTACTVWDDYYQITDENIHKNLWTSISENPEYSSFVSLVEEYALDSLFESNNSYTVFVPANSGFDSIDFTVTDPRTFIESHIVSTLYLLRNVQGVEKLKTLSGKYMVIEKDSSGYLFNKTRIAYQSDMHMNGVYYPLEGVSKPIDNLFQYVERINPSIAEYIATQDSAYLDLELSKPVDINENGEIIYDSVLISINLFEMLYFPLSEEFRDNRATLVIPTEEQYQASLNTIKTKLDLDPTFVVPKIWQHNVLMPFILNHGIFEGLLEAENFDIPKLKNIIGDSVIIDYRPKDQYLCSNGIAYQYDEFNIPDSLYLAGSRKEGESLVSPRGLDLFAWKDASVVRLFGETSFAPIAQKVLKIASNDSILYVDFGNNFEGEYAVEFKIENVFPGRYQCIWRSNPRSGGVYSMYINDVQQELPFGFTEFDLKYLSGGVISVTGDQYFYPKDGYNMLDCLADIEEFGDVWIKLEYKGPGDNVDNGLIIDYVELVPYN